MRRLICVVIYLWFIDLHLIKRRRYRGGGDKEIRQEKLQFPFISQIVCEHSETVFWLWPMSEYIVSFNLSLTADSRLKLIEKEEVERREVGEECWFDSIMPHMEMSTNSCLLMQLHFSQFNIIKAFELVVYLWRIRLRLPYPIEKLCESSVVITNQGILVLVLLFLLLVPS